MLSLARPVCAYEGIFRDLGENRPDIQKTSKKNKAKTKQNKKRVPGEFQDIPFFLFCLLVCCIPGRFSVNYCIEAIGSLNAKLPSAAAPWTLWSASALNPIRSLLVCMHSTLQCIESQTKALRCGSLLLAVVLVIAVAVYYGLEGVIWSEFKGGSRVGDAVDVLKQGWARSRSGAAVKKQTD